MTWRKTTDNLDQEIKERLDIRDKIIFYPCDYLNDSLYGIAPNDFITIASMSGAGKTQFCVNVALNAVSQNKKVYMFALEAEKYEITRRLKFKIFQDLFYQRSKTYATYQDWVMGAYLPDQSDIEVQANNIFKKTYQGDFYVFYKESKFDVYTMIEEILKISSEADLIIIDHKDYFDLNEENKNFNENRAVKEIIKMARDLVLENSVPIILISHVRKGSGEFKTPTMDDFHGTSELYKIATQAIMFGRGEPIENEPTRFYTYCSVVKNRRESSPTAYTAQLVYNAKKGGYENGYLLGKNNQKRDKEFEPIGKNSVPLWARRSDNRTGLLHGYDTKPILPDDKRGKGSIKCSQYKDDL